MLFEQFDLRCHACIQKIESIEDPKLAYKIFSAINDFYQIANANKLRETVNKLKQTNNQTDKLGNE